jgi:hypothetical protein
MKLGGGHARPCHATTVPSLLGCDLQDEEIVAPGSEEPKVVATMASMPRDLAAI